jgi:predicted metal-dependent hydrolase
LTGTGSKAVNNRRRNFREARLTKALRAIEEKIRAYLGLRDGKVSRLSDQTALHQEQEWAPDHALVR